MKQICFTVFILFYFFNLQAKIHFISVKSEAWQKETLATFQKINELLPDSWEKPQNFSVAFVEGQDAAYYPIFRYKEKDGSEHSVEKLLVIGDSAPAKLIHEYGHLVFDKLLRSQSVPWQYFLIWLKIDFSNVDQQLVKYQRQIVSLQEIHAEFVEKKQEGVKSEMIKNVIKNTASSIEKYENLVVELTQAQEMAASYPHPLDTIDSFKALQSYNELFADALAVLVLDDWSVMKTITAQDMAEKKLADRLVLPPMETKELAIQEYLFHRDFTTGLDVDSYPYQDWQLKSPYWQFPAIRSLIRDRMELQPELSRQKVVKALAHAIIVVYEQELIANPDNLQRSLLEKNRSLEAQLSVNLDR